MAELWIREATGSNEEAPLDGQLGTAANCGTDPQKVGSVFGGGEEEDGRQIESCAIDKPLVSRSRGYEIIEVAGVSFVDMTVKVLTGPTLYGRREVPQRNSNLER